MAENYFQNKQQLIRLQATLHQVVKAWKHTTNNKVEIEASKICGCFYCLAIFKPAKIIEWINRNLTAICPKCTVDTVIGSASDLPISEDFLRQARAYWFKIKE